jgi:hypothetical protein
MKRVGAWVLLVAVAGAGGCASPAKYVEKQGDAGVVAIPNNTDSWPSYHRRAALDLIRKHVGPQFEIVEEREVVVGQTTHNNQQVNTEQTVNSRIPFLPAERQTITNTTTQHDITEWRIVYRRKQSPVAGPMTPGAPGGQVVQTQYPAAGAVPGVQPAGGTPPTGTTGTGSYLIPSVKPAGAGGPDCDT